MKLGKTKQPYQKQNLTVVQKSPFENNLPISQAQPKASDLRNVNLLVQI